MPPTDTNARSSARPPTLAELVHHLKEAHGLSPWPHFYEQLAPLHDICHEQGARHEHPWRRNG